MLPVNLTLAAYGAAIVLGGSILGLVLYFLATQVRHGDGGEQNISYFSLQTRTRYNGGYYNNYYNHHGHGHSQYLVDRMDQARGFDILGLIGNALNMYQDSQQDKTEDYYVYQ